MVEGKKKVDRRESMRGERGKTETCLLLSCALLLWNITSQLAGPSFVLLDLATKHLSVLWSRRAC